MMKTLLTLLFAALIFVGCEEKEPEVAPPINEEAAVDPAEEMMEEGHDEMHDEMHGEAADEHHEEMHGEAADDHHGEMHGEMDGEGGTVEVSAEGTKFEPPIASERVPEGAWYCDMGTVHYASTDKGDGKCPECGMKLVQK